MKDEKRHYMTTITITHPSKVLVHPADEALSSCLVVHDEAASFFVWDMTPTMLEDLRNQINVELERLANK